MREMWKKSTVSDVRALLAFFFDTDQACTLSGDVSQRQLVLKGVPVTVAQIWKSTKFTVERNQGKTPGTIIFRFSGPFTARDMYSCLSPDAFRKIFESPSDTEQPSVHILDLSEVPYIDSRGLGMLVSHYVRCQRNGTRMLVAGAGPRVLQLFQLTKVGTFIPMIPTVQESDQQ